jgi:hypothetical protein
MRTFFQELLDQELREQIAEEINPVRTLILAHAFSKVDLIKRAIALRFHSQDAVATPNRYSAKLGLAYYGICFLVVLSRWLKCKCLDGIGNS